MWRWVRFRVGLLVRGPHDLAGSSWLADKRSVRTERGTRLIPAVKKLQRVKADHRVLVGAPTGRRQQTPPRMPPWPKRGTIQTTAAVIGRWLFNSSICADTALPGACVWNIVATDSGLSAEGAAGCRRPRRRSLERSDIAPNTATDPRLARNIVVGSGTAVAGTCIRNRRSYAASPPGPSGSKVPPPPIHPVSLMRVARFSVQPLAGSISVLRSTGRASKPQ